MQDRAGRRFVLPHDARGDVHVPRARDPELPAAAAGLVPLPDQGSRRAAAAQRPDPRPRVHHEGLVLVRPRRGRPRPELPGARGRLPPDLPALRDRVLRRAGRVGDDGRQRVDRLPRARRARARTRSSPARTATSPPTSRSRAPCRARRTSRRRSTRRRRSRRPGSRRARTSRRSSGSTSRRRRRRCR